MKKQIFSLALLSLIASSCSDTADLINSIVNPEDKEMISFSTNESLTPLTRAGFIGAATNIAARFVSTDGSNTRHTNTLMNADIDQGGDATNMATYSYVNYPSNLHTRYWDDAFGRAAKVSIYGIAVPNSSSSLTNNGKTLENLLDQTGTVVNATTNPNWKTGAADKNSVSWQVTTAAQTSTLIDKEDLCYTNNIQETNGALGKNGRRVYGAHTGSPYTATEGYPDYYYDATPGAEDIYPTLDDGELTFKLNDVGQPTGPGHFDRGHMIFYHALSRISIDLYAGDGFEMDAVAGTPSTKFTFNPISTNITLKNMPWKGTLDIKAGTWSNIAKMDITKMHQTADNHGSSMSNTAKATTPVYSLTAQVLPGYQFSSTDNTTNVMVFNVDDNEYYVTQKQIYDALTAAGATLEGYTGSEITMEQGKHYKFKITVGKTGIKALTCTLIDWENVEGTFEAKNAYITLNLLDPGTTDATACNKFDLYRILNENPTVTTPTNTSFTGTKSYLTGYSTDPMWKISTEGSPAGITFNSETNKWETPWFFENNKSFYQFRTVNPGVTLTTASADYFTMYSGPVCDDLSKGYSNVALDGMIEASAYKFNDYHWGATFPNSAASGFLNYSTTNGFDTQLSDPIGPTKSTISIVEQHMMSNIRVILLTPASGTDAVTLFDNSVSAPRVVSEVQLTNFSGTAKVQMGNGFIIPDQDYTSKKTTTPAYTEKGPGATKGTHYFESNTHTFSDGVHFGNYWKSYAYTYRVVPQELSRGTGASNKVGITIQTPDDNMYYVVEDLSEITGTVSGNTLKRDHTDGAKITRWNPGYTYTYYFILTKTGIKALTCTIVDWVNVEAANKDITLED